jgi:hypothetical protein
MRNADDSDQPQNPGGPQPGNKITSACWFTRARFPTKKKKKKRKSGQDVLPGWSIGRELAKVAGF